MEINQPGADISIGGTIIGGTAGSILFIDPSETLAQDNANLFWDNTNNRLGLGTTTPSSDLSFGISADKTIGVERNTVSNTAGKALTVSSGGAKSGATDKAGGDLILSGGTSTGYNKSDVYIKGAPRIVTGALGAVTIDTGFSDAGWSVGDIATESSGGNATIRIDTVDGSGYPLTATVTNGMSGYYANGGAAGYYGFNNGPTVLYTLTNTITGTSDNSPANVAVFRGNNILEINPDGSNGLNQSQFQANYSSVYPFQPYSFATYNPNYLGSGTSGEPYGVYADWTGAINARYISLYSGDPSYTSGFNLIDGNFLISNKIPGDLITKLSMSSSGNFDTAGSIQSPNGGFGSYQNYIVHSENLSANNWVKSGCTITPDSVVGPNGLTTADLITTTVNDGGVRQAFVAPSTGTYTFSFFGYASSNTDIQYVVGGNTSGKTLTNSWSRYESSASLTAGTSYNLVIRGNLSGVSFSVWGMQVELASSKTSYVRTEGQNLSTAQKGTVSTGGYNLFQNNAGFGGVLTPVAPIDVLGTINGSVALTPSMPISGTPTSGGSVTTGTHTWKYTYVTAQGETTPSPASAIRTIGATNKTVALTFAVGPAGTIARKIYRTVAGNTGNYKLVTTIADNTTTTYVDTTADAGLGADAPTTNTTGNLTIATGGTTAITIDSNQRTSLSGVANLKNYTVATLPAGTRGDVAYVTDALLPVYLANVAGGGAVVTPVFYNGANWICH